MPNFDLDSALQQGGTSCPACGSFVVADDDAHLESAETWDAFTSWERSLTDGVYVNIPVVRHRCPGCQARVYVLYKPVSTTLMAGREDEMANPEETKVHYLEVASKPECADCGECTDISMSDPVAGQPSMLVRYECNNCGCFWEVVWEVDHEFKP